MTDKPKNEIGKEEEFYKSVAKAADFTNKRRIGNADASSGLNNSVEEYADGDKPTIAPSMNTHDELEENATKEEIKEGESTSVTRLYLDRTPED